MNGRREFLVWLTRGSLLTVSALAIGQLARYFSYEPSGEAPSIIAAGKPDTYAAGTLTYVGETRTYIGRDDKGLYAIDAVCTHLGCLVEQKAGEGFACPCHGSRFAADGQVAERPGQQGIASPGPRCQPGRAGRRGPLAPGDPRRRVWRRTPDIASRARHLRERLGRGRRKTGNYG